MAESFKSVIEKIKKDEKIKDKDGAIQKKIEEKLKDLKEERHKRSFFRELAYIENKKYLNSYIGEPEKKILMTREKTGDQLDPYYYWILGFLKDDLAIPNFRKIIDTYTTSEASAFGREMGGATTAVQNQAVQTMRSLSEMVKNLFRMIRDLKVANDQLDMMRRGREFGAEKVFEKYKGAIPKEKEIKTNSAEIALKSRWVDLVDGGAQHPTSVFGLARQGGPGFITLPKYFFHIHVFDPSEVDDVLKKYSTRIAGDLRDILARKLQQYATWRISAESNYRHRRNIMLKYLKQHYNALKLNIQWLKPYLRTAQRLQQDYEHKESVDIIGAIDQATMEVEIFAMDKKVGDYNPIINLHFYYRTFPKTQYSPKYRGSEISHTGRIEIEFMTRVLTDDQILAYETLKQEEDFELLKEINVDITLAMEEMGGDLRKYLEARQEELTEEEKEEFGWLPGYEPKVEEKEEKKEGLKLGGFFEPAIGVFKGFKEMGHALVPIERKEKEKSRGDPKKDREEALKTATVKFGVLYDIFKKAHRMLSL